MLKRTNDLTILQYILKNIREEDKQELIATYADNWYEKTIESFNNRDFLVLYGFDNKENFVPIAIGGADSIFDKSHRIASVWLLSTIWVKRNKKIFFKVLKNQLKLAEKEFDILFNFVYKSNYGAKFWIKKLGFNFSNTKPKEFSIDEGFEFFYKTLERSE